MKREPIAFLSISPTSARAGTSSLSETAKGIDRLIRTCKTMLKKTEDPVTIRELQRRIGVFLLKHEDGKADTRKSLSYLEKSVEAGSPAAKEDLLEALWADESTPDEEVLQMARERRVEGSPWPWPCSEWRIRTAAGSSRIPRGPSSSCSTPPAKASTGLRRNCAR